MLPKPKTAGAATMDKEGFYSEECGAEITKEEYEQYEGKCMICGTTEEDEDLFLTW
jgi:hypothetical protein